MMLVANSPPSIKLPGSMNPNQYIPTGPRLTHQSSSSAAASGDFPPPPHPFQHPQQQQQMFLVQQTARPPIGGGYGAPRLSFPSAPQSQQYMTMVPANVVLGRHSLPSQYQALQPHQRLVLVPEQLHQYPPQFAEQIHSNQQTLSYPVSSPAPFVPYTTSTPLPTSSSSSPYHHSLLVSSPAPTAAFHHQPLIFQQPQSRPHQKSQIFPDPQTQMIAHVKRMTDPVMKRLKAASSASSSADSEPEERKRRKRESEGSRRTNLNDLVSVVEQAVLKDMNRMDRFADKVTVLDCTVRLLQERYGLKPALSSSGNSAEHGGEESDDASSSVSALDADLSGPALDRNTKKTLRERRRRRAMNRHLTTLRQLLHLEGGTEKKAILNAVIDFLAGQQASSSSSHGKPVSTPSHPTVSAMEPSSQTITDSAVSPSKTHPQAPSSSTSSN